MVRIGLRGKTVATESFGQRLPLLLRVVLSVE
jgi:hypothetical protein